MYAALTLTPYSNPTFFFTLVCVVDPKHTPLSFFFPFSNAYLGDSSDACDVGVGGYGNVFVVIDDGE